MESIRFFFGSKMQLGQVGLVIGLVTRGILAICQSFACAVHPSPLWLFCQRRAVQVQSFEFRGGFPRR